MGAESTPAYVPVLKAKAAEWQALKEAPESVRERIVPLIEVPPAPRSRDEEHTRKPIVEHLTPVGNKLAGSWGGEHRVMVDLPHVERESALADGAHPATIVFRDALEDNVRIVPVVGLKRDVAYVVAAIETAKTAGEGMALRITDAELGDVQALDYAARRLLSDAGLGREDVDVILDAGEVTAEQVNTRAAGLRAIISAFPARRSWRSLTVLSGAFPQSLSSLRGNSIRRIRRADWELWRTISTEGVGRPVRFGDYAIDSPIPFDPENPRTIQISASIRYTSAEVFIVVKGRSTKVHGWEQTARLCEVLVDTPEYMGAHYSTGDAYIAKRARGAVTCGNPTVWRRVGLSHHLVFVTDQLAMYGAP